MQALTSMLVLAQDAPLRPQSLLSWMFESLGLFYALVLPLAGFALFVGACLVVALSRRPAVVAAYLVFLPLPLLIGVCGSLEGFIRSLSIIAMAGGTPRAADVAEGISTGLFTSWVGLLVVFPTYFVLALGLFLRTLLAPANGSSKE